MTHSFEGSDVPDAIRELHEHFSTDELVDGSNATTNANTNSHDQDEHDIDDAIQHLGLDAMSQEARGLLLRLTDASENLEPKTRQLLVTAAERGLH
jgi:hypothetical protein